MFKKFLQTNYKVQIKLDIILFGIFSLSFFGFVSNFEIRISNF